MDRDDHPRDGPRVRDFVPPPEPLHGPQNVFLTKPLVSIRNLLPKLAW
jgi:hypothetical protein